MKLEAGKLHMVRPANDPEVPWTAMVVGLWIPNFFYWGLNITQRTLGSKSLAEGQRDVVFTAFLKPLIPFVVLSRPALARVGQPGTGRLPRWPEEECPLLTVRWATPWADFSATRRV